ncbi:hypothetical protein SLS62_008083 [Diatrype stigma]|uniref:Gustatory receptor n=1 Tax=Diatrype stigma TaxID=117547 RepID=A0AAN9YQ39_9PEZI
MVHSRLLWTTWLMVTIYDVRYTSDSVFERCCRAIHLGVMIGFAEFGTNFDPENQIKVIFQSLSLFLAASRFTLAMQYGLLAWQVRKYTDGKKPLITTAALHFIAAAIYFGISFRYDVGKNSRVYVMWYITGTIETALHLGFSNLSRVLSFIGTHFGERMNLLTLIIVGEGRPYQKYRSCIILLKNITLLVKDTYIKDISSKWSRYKIYFDWLHEGQHGPMFEAHQVWWAVIHLPFHIALVLMLEGVMQFVSYVRIMETVNSSMQQLENASVYLEDAPTSKEVSETLGDIVYNFLEEYPPPEILETYERTNETLEHIAEIDDSFWDDSNYSPDNPVYVEWSKDVADLYSTMVNAVFYAFGIEQPGEEESGATGHEDHVELQTTLAISERYRLTAGNNNLILLKDL